MLIIETNLIFPDNVNLSDHQSFVTTIDSWDNYIKKFKEYNGGAIKDYHKRGCSLPANVSITRLEYDDFHLLCEVNNKNIREIHLAYICSN
jgi:hypothetical protein